MTVCILSTHVHFLLMLQGIEALLPFINKRKVMLTQEDVMVLLTQDRPFCTELSSTTREQLDKIEGLLQAKIKNLRTTDQLSFV